MHKDKISVRLFGKPIGILERNQKEKLHFHYLENAEVALSLSLPLKEKSFDHAHTLPFFTGLLPENMQTLSTIGKVLGTDPYNAFNLLSMMGFDCQGSVSFHALTEEIQIYDCTLLKANVISEIELENHLHQLRLDPFFIRKEGFRAILSGIHEKVPVCLIDNQVAIPVKGHFTTHILKPGYSSFENKIINEYFCLRIAKRLGLHVVNVELRNANKTSYLLIPRYDREIQEKTIKHYHQEDFCQALGYESLEKFQKNGGPCYKSCFTLLQKTNIPAIDRNHFIKMIIFNYLIGNMNAHAKNFALRYLTPKHVQLAPMYDISCSLIDNNCFDMAMKLAGVYDRNQISSQHWKFLCDKRGYSFSAFKNIYQEMSESIVYAAKAERLLMKEQSINIEVVDKILKVLQKKRGDCK
jgi:serine/threonine-protein kinase HipA